MSKRKPPPPMGPVETADKLRSVVERIESLESEKREIAEGISEVYDEAGDAGFDVKVLRAVIALRRKDPDEREQYLSLLDTYQAQLDAQPDAAGNS